MSDETTINADELAQGPIVRPKPARETAADVAQRLIAMQNARSAVSGFPTEEQVDRIERLAHAQQQLAIARLIE